MSMSKHRAKIIEEQLDGSTPFYTRVEFIESLAALTSLYKDEVQRKVTGSNKMLSKTLWCAAAPDRIEWLFNNIRSRRMMNTSHIKLLPSGSMSNEALHAEINAWFRTTNRMHQSTLTFKLKMMLLGKLTQHNNALYHPTSRQLTPGVVLARSLTVEQWTVKKWNAWCRQQRHGKVIKKASLPFTIQKNKERLKVKHWLRKRPASVVRVRDKRTVFSLARQSSLIRSGVHTVMRNQAVLH